MVNYEIQYTGKFDMPTYFFGTNSVVVLSSDCSAGYTVERLDLFSYRTLDGQTMTL